MVSPDFTSVLDHTQFRFCNKEKYKMSMAEKTDSAPQWDEFVMEFLIECTKIPGISVNDTDGKTAKQVWMTNTTNRMHLLSIEKNTGNMWLINNIVRDSFVKDLVNAGIAEPITGWDSRSPTLTRAKWIGKRDAVLKAIRNAHGTFVS